MPNPSWISRVLAIGMTLAAGMLVVGTPWLPARVVVAQEGGVQYWLALKNPCAPVLLVVCLLLSSVSSEPPLGAPRRGHVVGRRARGFGWIFAIVVAIVFLGGWHTGVRAIDLWGTDPPTERLAQVVRFFVGTGIVLAKGAVVVACAAGWRDRPGVAVGAARLRLLWAAGLAAWVGFAACERWVPYRFCFGLVSDLVPAS